MIKKYESKFGKERIEEGIVEFNKNSIMHNGSPSSDFSISQTGFKSDNARISLYVNGGSAYEFTANIGNERIAEVQDRDKLTKIGEDIALKVANLIQKEVEKAMKTLLK